MNTFVRIFEFRTGIGIEKSDKFRFMEDGMDFVTSDERICIPTEKAR